MNIFFKNKTFFLVVACGKGGKVVNFNFPLFHAFHKSFLSLVLRPSSPVIPKQSPSRVFATFLKTLYIYYDYIKGFFVAIVAKHCLVSKHLFATFAHFVFCCKCSFFFPSFSTAELCYYLGHDSPFGNPRM